MSDQGGEGTKIELKPVLQTPIWKHLLWAGVAIATLWALSKIPSTLIVFSMAWLIAYLLNPAVDYLAGRRLGPIKECTRGQAVTLVAGLLLGLVVAAGSMMLPQITDQVERLISLQQSLGDPQELPIILRQKAEPWLAKVPDQYREVAMTKASTLIQESASKIGQWASAIIKSIGAFIGQLFSAVFLVCSAFLVSLYMLMNWHTLAGDFLEKLPRQYQREVRSLSVKLNEIFGGYLKATILTAIACMIATFVFLLLLCMITGNDFPYKGLVAFVAGLSYPVPVIGIIGTSILGGVLGFVTNPGDGAMFGHVGFGVLVLVTINVVNIIIDRTVQPRLMSDAIGVSELFVMFAAFAGGEVAGVWGMLLGIPVAAMGKTLFEWFHLNFLVVDDHHDDGCPHVPQEELIPASATLAPEPTPVLMEAGDGTPVKGSRPDSTPDVVVVQSPEARVEVSVRPPDSKVPPSPVPSPAAEGEVAAASLSDPAPASDEPSAISAEPAPASAQPPARAESAEPASGTPTPGLEAPNQPAEVVPPGPALPPGPPPAKPVSSPKKGKRKGK